MNKVLAVAAALALLCLGGIAQAVTIATVPVGDAGNVADTHGAGYGSVGYNYKIGKYEVTAAQYTDFLNKVARTDAYGLYNTLMDTAVNSNGCNIKRSGYSGSYTYSVAAEWANRPVNWVSYWDSCRFANWLHNGQPTGLQTATTTERGAYALDGYRGSDGRTIERNAGWNWAVTSEDEWYKAAYYKSGGTTAGYWDHPTKNNTVPANQVINPDPGNSANYRIQNYSIGSPYYRTNVGEFENSASAYGTFDQGGNVCEWNEAIPRISGDNATAYRSLRGGSFLNDAGYLLAYSRNDYTPPGAGFDLGFRVSEVVPEPSSIIALAGGLISLLGIRRGARRRA